MSSLKSGRLTGAILLLVAVGWIAGVFWTIPEVAGGARVGPRGFPLAMGVALAALALMLMAGGNDAPANDAPAIDRRTETWALLSTFGFLAVYVALLDLFGFLIATTTATTGFLVVVVNKRSPKLVVLTSLGLAVSVWLILGKAMGVYLPRGSIVDWF